MKVVKSLYGEYKRYVEAERDLNKVSLDVQDNYLLYYRVWKIQESGTLIIGWNRA